MWAVIREAAILLSLAVLWNLNQSVVQGEEDT
jgi:hypothetical protein